MAWDERSIEILKSNWKTKTASQIAELIGGVSRNAVIGKANRLNLSAKIKTRSTASNETFENSIDDKNIKIKRGRRSKFVLNKSMLDQLGPAKLLTLEELTETTCKYMIHEDQGKEGHPNMPGSFFCGRDTVPKYSYCLYHMGLVWQPKGKKEDVVNKNEEIPDFIEKKIKSAG
uniref:GcrA cell cycle regulator n=1 Tax=uncultured SAR11 cluster bacterium HF0010_09O16 TaxID=710725 RepID=E0XWZ0_9PROT|nr:hypothetical protein [uncultured SAR11 cluster bacterium HF0010_09O16]